MGDLFQIIQAKLHKLQQALFIYQNDHSQCLKLFLNSHLLTQINFIHSMLTLKNNMDNTFRALFILTVSHTLFLPLTY